MKRTYRGHVNNHYACQVGAPGLLPGGAYCHAVVLPTCQVQGPLGRQFQPSLGGHCVRMMCQFRRQASMSGKPA